MEITLWHQRRARRPGDFQRGGGLNGLPWLLRHNTDEVVPDDDADAAGHALDRATVNPSEGGAGRRRTHHAAMKHPGHSYVMHEFEAPGHQRRNLDARDGRTQDSPG